MKKFNDQQLAAMNLLGVAETNRQASYEYYQSLKACGAVKYPFLRHLQVCLQARWRREITAGQHVYLGD